MGNRFIIKTGIVIMLLLSSCIGWMDKEQFKEIQLNNEYKIDYVKYPQQYIKYFGIMDNKNGAIPVLAVELIYNNDYMYIYCDSATKKNPFLQFKIDLKSPEIGDYIEKEITKQEYNEFKSSCKDCIILNLDSLNKKDKDIPPIIMGRKQE